MWTIIEFIHNRGYRVEICGGYMNFPPNEFQKVVSDYERYKANKSNKPTVRIVSDSDIYNASIDHSSAFGRVEFFSEGAKWCREQYEHNSKT